MMRTTDGGVACPAATSRRHDAAADMASDQILADLLTDDIRSHPNSISVAIDQISFRHQVRCRSSSGRSAAKSYLRNPHIVREDSHVNSLPVRRLSLSDDDDEVSHNVPFLSGHCRVTRLPPVSQLLCQTLPFVVLERLDAALFQAYWNKYKGLQLAEQIAKTGERSSQRKRKPEQEPPPVVKKRSATASVSRKRVKSSLLICKPSLEIVPQKKRRIFSALPPEQVVPCIFRRLMSEEGLKEFRVTHPEPEVLFENPFLSVDLLEDLTFDDLLELSECSDLMDKDDACSIIRDGSCINVRDFGLQQRTSDSPDASNSHPAAAAGPASQESTEHAVSPPSESPHAPPVEPICVTSATDPSEQNMCAAGPSTASAFVPVTSAAQIHNEVKREAEELKVCNEETNPPLTTVANCDSQKEDGMADRKSVRITQSSPLNLCLNDSKPETKATTSQQQVAKNEKIKSERAAAGTSDKKVTCRHCFNSTLLMSETQLRQHTRFAHPDQSIIPALSPPASSRLI